MRRKDREVTDKSKIQEILDACHCCRLGFWDGEEVYIVPLNFGWTQENGNYVLYFHGAKEGRKFELLRKCPNVGFELDTHYQLKEAEIACGHSARFKSIIGTGAASIVTDKEEKRIGLLAIMEHNTGRREWTFDPRRLEGVCVFKVTVRALSCKEHL